ncbi:DUF4862 family protein [Thiotrichales bacterium 19X7-9]|nr:DUF4862 family protein [Thiotrichales bacterium 19X7-9]
MKTFYFSSYAMTPALDQFNESFESQYFKKLSQYQEIIGIEHPFLFDKSVYSNKFLKMNVPDHWQIIITALPVTMQSLKEDQSFGLASSVESSRQKAIDVMHQINHKVIELNNLFQRQVVKAIHFQTAPANHNHMKGSKRALIDSLEEIRKWDWQSAQLNIEHCDAKMNDRVPEKGFLSLEDEIDAITEVGGFGLMLNWGRSVIEGHSIEQAIKHIKLASQSNCLNGYFFSGCTNNLSSSYGAFKDSHMPPKLNNEDDTKDSLLNEVEISKVYQQLIPSTYLGIKVSPSVKQFDLNSLLSMTEKSIAILS